MPLKLISFGLLLIYLSPLMATERVYGHHPPLKRTDLRPYEFNNFSLSLNSWSVDGDRLRARGTGLKASGNFEAQLNSSIYFHAGAGFRIQTGSNNSLSLAEFAPEREWLLDHAQLEWKGLEFLNITLGAINQNWLNSPLLVSDMAFMAAKQKARINLPGSLSFTLSAQQSIPNNQTLSLRAGGIDEGTPHFFVQGGTIEFDSKFTSISASAHYFIYDKLASGVANQSRFMGNNIEGSSTQSRFVYGYEGWNSTLILAYHPSEILYQFYAQYLFNNKAPDEENTGFFVGPIIAHPNFKLALRYFYLEANASVGFYNEKKLGHNNKKGISLEFTKKNLANSFDLYFEYSRAQVIKSNPLDGDMDYFAISFIHNF